jgi:GT2 family glycosyltransferase
VGGPKNLVATDRKIIKNKAEDGNMIKDSGFTFQVADSSDLHLAYLAAKYYIDNRNFLPAYNITKVALKRHSKNISFIELHAQSLLGMNFLTEAEGFFIWLGDNIYRTTGLAVSYFDFLALERRYGELIVHVWNSAKANPANDLLQYFRSALGALAKMDSDFLQTFEDLSYSDLSDPLSSIFLSFNDLEVDILSPEIFEKMTRRKSALKASLAYASSSTEVKQLHHAMSVLEGGYDNVTLKPLNFREQPNPDVSIIIPMHNKVEVTYFALCSLLLARNEASFEIILVDDASTDETAKIENLISGVTIIRNSAPQRFIRACNSGAEKAKGKFIVLLNNDVEATAGWLDELIASFDRFESVGLAGAKLIYPDGRLQDAGGIVWNSGNPWNYGNGQNPKDPRFSYARQVDYLSGAAIMVPTVVWETVGGLSSYLEPMYFEDTDLAFKVREAGYSTWFVPSSVIYHYEGMTSGTDTSKGFKRYQEINRPKFKRKWAKAFSNFSNDGHQPDLEKDREIVGRVLFLDYTTPKPDQDAGSYAALQEIKLVQSLGYKVSFLPMDMVHADHYTENLQKLGVEAIYTPFFMTPEEYLEKHAVAFDAFYITRYHTAQRSLLQLRTFAPKTKIIFNNADLHFLREIRAARSASNLAMLDEARQTRSDEIEIINQVDVVLSYSDVEHAVIQAYTDGQATVLKCPWVIEPAKNIPKFERREGLCFLGSFQHSPNKEGVMWFVREVMPLLSSQGQDALTIYGSNMDDEIKALKSSCINPAGFVEQISDAYERHRIFVAPLRSGAGIKGKVLGALAHGIPCVLSPIAAEGIGLRSGHDCLVVEDAQQWAIAIKNLQSDKALWTEISTNAQFYASNAFSFQRGRQLMRDAFEAAGVYRSSDKGL